MPRRGTTASQNREKGTTTMRKRFTSQERAALVPGTSVMWRDTSTPWYHGIVTAHPDRDVLGTDRVRIENLAKTRSVHSGQIVYGYPSMVTVSLPE